MFEFDFAFDNIKLSLERANGTGYYLIIFFVLFIYIFFRISKEEKKIKTFFRWYPVLILFIILNPLFHNIAIKFIAYDVYWRTFWCLPIGILIAYGFTLMIKDMKKDVIRNIGLVVIIVLIAVSGKFIYTNEFFEKVNNPYKIPDLAFEIIEEISNDEEEYKKVAGTEEIMVYMRQYDGNVLTEDYRSVEAYKEEWIISKINKGLVSVYANEARASKCNYIVIEKNVPIDDELENYGYEKIKENERYLLYKTDLNK